MKPDGSKARTQPKKTVKTRLREPQAGRFHALSSRTKLCRPGDTQLNRMLDKCYDSYVQTEQIVALLIEERDRLSRAIQALQSNASRTGGARTSSAAASRPANMPARKSPAAKPKRVLSAAGRRAIAEAARKRWAAIRAAKGAPETSKAKKAKS